MPKNECRESKEVCEDEELDRFFVVLQIGDQIRCVHNVFVALRFKRRRGADEHSWVLHDDLSGTILPKPLNQQAVRARDLAGRVEL